MRPACQKAFERDYGAKLVPVSFTLEALAADRRSKYRRGEHLPMGNYFLDHHECYNRNGRPWAIVSHTYERDIDGNARQLARDQGLAVFTLPWGPVGWYNPGDAWTFITSRLDDDAPSTWHILLASLLWNRM